MPPPSTSAAAIANGEIAPRGPNLSKGHIAIDDIQSPILQAGLEIWNRTRGKRPFPSRHDMSPRVLGALLRHTALLKVIEDGRDFEFRVIGDGIVMAQGHSHQGMRVSEIGGINSPLGDEVLRIYRGIVRTQAPAAYRGPILRPVDHGTLHRESLLLPLGPAGGGVEYILAVIVYSAHPDMPVH